MSNIAQGAQLPSNPTAWVQYPVKANVQIWTSAHVMIVAGYLTNAADTPGGTYVGQAMQDILGGTTDGAVTCNVLRRSELGIVTLSATSPTQAGWVGNSVAFTDNQTVNLNASTTNHVVAGMVTQIVQTGAAGLIKVDVQNHKSNSTTN
jgi:hypothetical protein